MQMLAWISRNDVSYRQKPQLLIVRCHEQMCAPISIEHARFRRHFSRGDAGLSLLAVRDTALLCECEFRDSDDMFHSSSEDHLRRGQIPVPGGASSRDPVSTFGLDAAVVASLELRPPLPDLVCRSLFALHKIISSVCLSPTAADWLETPVAAIGSGFRCQCVAELPAGLSLSMQTTSRHFL